MLKNFRLKAINSIHRNLSEINKYYLLPQLFTVTISWTVRLDMSGPRTSRVSASRSSELLLLLLSVKSSSSSSSGLVPFFVTALSMALQSILASFSRKKNTIIGGDAVFILRTQVLKRNYLYLYKGASYVIEYSLTHKQVRCLTFQS